MRQKILKKVLAIGELGTSNINVNVDALRLFLCHATTVIRCSQPASQVQDSSSDQDRRKN